MKKTIAGLALRLNVALLMLLATTLGAQTFDIVIANGRVIDPESKLDAVRHIGIQGGTIRAVSARPLSGKQTIDARGHVVAPGFIDLHWHGQKPEGYLYNVRDGVTTALEMEVGVGDIDRWYAERAGRIVMNYGAAVGHIPVRMAVLKDPGDFLPAGAAAERAATPEEVAQILAGIEKGLKRGAAGVGFGIAYTPRAEYQEILEAFRVAARFGAPCHVHMRHDERTRATAELIGAAAATGAPLHIVHINSSGGAVAPQLLDLIAGARARGLDVTSEAYPYTAGSTRIETALFNDWESQPDSWFAQLQWVATGERLTRATFEKYRKQGGLLVQHSNTEASVLASIRSPLTMIASDGFDLAPKQGHPRAAGTYSRVLARYVREQGVLTLNQAIEKMTLMSARRLEKRVPAMRNKGRIRVGADADIVVFDPATVTDHATYEEPTAAPTGIPWVLVNGVVVVRQGELEPGVTPGKPVRAPVVESR
jgi:dihydroorotase